MIRVRQIKVGIYNDSIDSVKRCVANKIGVKISDILDVKVIKKSIDARRKNNVFYVYEVLVNLKSENVRFSNDVLKYDDKDYEFCVTGNKKMQYQPIIVGSGPAGLFCGYFLALNGYKPVIVEQGEDVDNRINSVNDFWLHNNLNVNSNVQFGEGGAGTFSDGKLNTLVRDKSGRMKAVFELFVKCGAPADILYTNKPHIGTDLLRDVIKNIRNEIIKLGGIFKYNTKFNDVVIEDGVLKKVKLNDYFVDCEVLILAIGNSARDTFEMLFAKKIDICSKPFAVGLRFQHPQMLIDVNQYGNNEILYPASYKLSYSKDRGVYSFCMCPGGFVVNASSEKNHLVINGMSNHNRDEENANSAIVVTVSDEDFGCHPLDGLKFQRDLEKKAYDLGKGKIPIQLYADFKNNVKTTKLGRVKPIFKGEYTFSNLNDILPSYIVNSIIEAIDYFDGKINGFAASDVILAGVETRTSSPIRILRDEFFQTNIKGIFPCGEGAGYAGGITTSAMDGIKVAEAVASIYRN